MNLVETSSRYLPSDPSADADLDWEASGNTKAGADMNAGLLLRTAIRRLPLFVLAIIIGGGLGVAALRILPSRYTSVAAIMIDPKRPGSVGEDGQFANLSIDSARIANVEQVIGSSELLSRVVTSEHLLDMPAFAERHSSIIRNLIPFLALPQLPDSVEARRARAIERLGEMVHTTREGITYVIAISVSAGDPALAQRLARAIAEAYLTDQVETKLEAVRRDTSWLTDQLVSQRKELLKSEAAVETIRRKYGLLAASSGTETSVDRQSITQVNTALVSAQGDLDSAAAKYKQAQHVLKTGGNLASVSDVASAGIIDDLRRQQAVASQHVAELSVRYGPDYPTVREAVRNRDVINGQLAQQSSRIVEMLHNDYQTAMSRRDELQQQLATLVGAVSAADLAEGRIELREAERVSEANRAVYDASLAGLRQVKQQQTRDDAEARIISYPHLPEAPSFPKASLCLAGGLAFGALIGGALIFLIPYHRNRVVDVATARRATSLPVLASTPFLFKHDLGGNAKPLWPHEYLVAKPMSPFADSLKLLRLHLRLGAANGPKIVQITSATPGEGKSTIAAALAVSAAAAGMRAVLLDLDLHRPSIGKIFGGRIFAEGQSKAFFDVLLPSDKANDESAQPRALPLSIIDAAGMIGGPRSHMMEDVRLHELIRDLETKFDLIVVDTSPVLAISDALFISHVVDATIVVVAWDCTSQKCVDDAVSQLRAAGAPLSGLVLNKVNPSRAAGFGMPYYNYHYAAA